MKDYENFRYIKCEDCIWYGQCEDSWIDDCIDGFPVNNMDDEVVDRIIEYRRDEYRKEWSEYIEENNED